MPKYISETQPHHKFFCLSMQYELKKNEYHGQSYRIQVFIILDDLFGKVNIQIFSTNNIERYILMS